MSQRKTARWLDLIAFLLQHRFPVTREDIFERVQGYKDDWERAESERERESLRRKFERDKDELRALGINIETIELPDAAFDEPQTAYRLKPAEFYLPYLELATEDAPPPARPYQGLRRITVSNDDLALLDRATRRIAERTECPLAEAARSARCKLEFDLPIPEQAIEKVLAEPVDNETTKSLEVLQRAVAAKHPVSCRYYTIGRDAEATRDIEPYGLFFSWGRWYCVARARDRDALRVFRVDRMSEANLLTGKDAAFEVPAGFSVQEYVGRAPWDLSEREPTLVIVQFAFPESRWVQARGVGNAVEPLMDDGGAILEFQVRDRHPFLRWLLTFRDHARVLEPGSLLTELAQLRGRVAALYNEA